MTENSLILFTQANKMLAEATTIQKAKELKSLALTAAEWAKQKKLGNEAVQYARGYALEADRKIGELLKETERAKGKRTDLVPKEYQVERPTLADLGLTKKESSNAQFLANLPEEDFDKIKNGSMTAHEATRAIKIKNRESIVKRQAEEIASGGLNLPQGLYEIIVIDPPWPYSSNYDPYGFRGTTDYPEMRIEDLQKLEIPCTKNSVLFLWTTHKFMWDANELLDWWGFAYRNIIVWNKVKMGIGKLFRLQCEFCLVGIKGNPIFDNDNTHRDIIEESRREHSRKPEYFYDMVDSLCIGRKVDMFGRERRDGWDIWGLEKWGNSKTI